MNRTEGLVEPLHRQSIRHVGAVLGDVTQGALSRGVRGLGGGIEETFLVDELPGLRALRLIRGVLLTTLVSSGFFFFVFFFYLDV